MLGFFRTQVLERAGWFKRYFFIYIREFLVVPAVDGAKFVSEVYAQTGDVGSVVNNEAANLTTWACDLDWGQPDPFGDSSSLVFDSADGYCSVDEHVIILKAKGVSDAVENIPTDIIQKNSYANIEIACTYHSNYFYCTLLFSDVRPVRSPCSS